jgi:hypothetical protein
MYIVDDVFRSVVPILYHKINSPFLFHVFKIQSCMYRIYKGFSRNRKTNRLVPKIARKISDQKLAGIHGVQFVTNFCCIQFWFVCVVPKYMNVFTLLADLGARSCSRAMYVRQCEANILIKQLSGIADLHLPCA